MPGSTSAMIRMTRTPSRLSGWSAHLARSTSDLSLAGTISHATQLASATSRTAMLKTPPIINTPTPRRRTWTGRPTRGGGPRPSTRPSMRTYRTGLEPIRGIPGLSALLGVGRGGCDDLGGGIGWQGHAGEGGSNGHAQSPEMSHSPSQSNSSYSSVSSAGYSASAYSHSTSTSTSMTNSGSMKKKWWLPSLGVGGTKGWTSDVGWGFPLGEAARSFDALTFVRRRGLACVVFWEPRLALLDFRARLSNFWRAAFRGELMGGVALRRAPALASLDAVDAGGA
ncbi:hypothetical protein C8R44DRAFT_992224 [Mycena epipterygia]|nr:hypothetical protein C8R44DRAFT_992224 [Mycena epipterygia]